MKTPPRKIRIAIILAIAVVVAFVSWRTSAPQQPAEKKCVPGRHEEKDASGKVIRVTRTTCFD